MYGFSCTFLSSPSLSRITDSAVTAVSQPGKQKTLADSGLLNTLKELSYENKRRSKT